MAGLDTRGAFDGFVKGFGMMQGYQDSKDRKAYMQEQQAMQQRGLEMREREFSQRQDQQQKLQDQELVKQFYTGWANGVEVPVTPELEQAFERNKMLDARHLFRPDVEAAVQYADKLSQGEGSLFSQETVDAMNAFYGPRVNRGAGGKKRLSGIYPGQKEGTFVFELEVEDEQGNKRSAPMTVNRGLEGEDDEVAQYDIEQAIGPVMGAKSIYKALGDNREKMIAYLQSSGFLPKEEAKWEQVQGPGGSILQRNTKTGELKNVLGRAPQQGGGAGGAAYAPSSDVKTLEYLKASGMSDKEARDELVRLKRGDSGGISASDRYRVTYISNLIKEIDTQLQGFPDPETAEQLLARRDELVQQRSQLESELGLMLGSAGQFQPEQGWVGVGESNAPPAQPIQGASEADNELRSLWNGSLRASNRADPAEQGPIEQAEGTTLGLNTDGLSYQRPAETPNAPNRKRYQLGLADALLPSGARDAVASIPGRVADQAVKANAAAVFRKALNRNPSDEELAALIDMGRTDDGGWSAPHWRVLKEHFE